MWICDGRRKDPSMHCSIETKFICLSPNQSKYTFEAEETKLISKYVQISCYACHVKLHRTLHQASWVIPLLFPEVRAACAAATACCSKVMLCCSAKASAAAAATAAFEARNFGRMRKICIYIHRTYIIILYVYILYDLISIYLSMVYLFLIHAFSMVYPCLYSIILLQCHDTPLWNELLKTCPKDASFVLTRTEQKLSSSSENYHPTDLSKHLPTVMW